MADILIKGLHLPKDWEMVSVNINRDGKVTLSSDLSCEQIAEAVIVPTHGPLIDARKLYNKAAKFERKALNQLARMQDENTEEWRRWSTILTERTAFKYDIMDAPVIIEASEDGKRE